MKKHGISFKWVYLIYVVLLAALVTAAVLYVRGLLHRYEDSQPDFLAQNAVAELAANASSASAFWSQYGLPQVEPGRFEPNADVQNEFLALFSGELSVSEKGGSHAEDELFYTVECEGFPLAEVKLKATGPAVTKLAVLTMRDWAVESVTPVLEARDYTLTVPVGFAVQVNGVALTAADGTSKGERQMEYTVPGLYLKPDFQITDRSGNRAGYTVKNDRVNVEFYDYSLTLPAALTVSLDGKRYSGSNAGSGLLHYDISSAVKPAVTISDHFGNTVEYEGGNRLPLTYATINADTNYTVLVNGAEVPAQAISVRSNPEYAPLADFVPNLPQICTYSIAVLQEDAAITVTDAQGKPVVLEGDTHTYDLTGHATGLDAVPAEVAQQVDVLQIAQNWSLFMTNDLPFAEIKKNLISTSYQYDVAVKYATGVDIKFTSKHTLADPAFTDISVDNFMWITEDCFSVDIAFVKHMRLYYGAMVDDPMNDRFYFVRYDDTDNGVNDPAWKLASMKEIVE